MVRGMVDRLMTRLAEEGEPPDDWAWLIAALGVLGETARAQAIYEEALGRFAAAPAAVEQLNLVAQRAGLEPAEPPRDDSLRAPTAQELAPPAETGLSGPTQEDMDAAAQMAPEDRQEMVRDMVDRLMACLAEQGGTPPEWGRLITSLAVLGETERAQAIYDETLEKFAASEAELEVIRAAGARAGLDG